MALEIRGEAENGNSGIDQWKNAKSINVGGALRYRGAAGVRRRIAQA